MNSDSQQLALELRNVSLKRGGREIVRDISFSVSRGECAAILGPNGCGKSTIARILSGYLFPTAGEIWVGGGKYGEVDLNEMRRSVRLVQPAGPYDVDSELTVGEVVLTGLFGTIGLYEKTTNEDCDRAEELLAGVGLSAVRHSRYATLSSGERVRALIARALMREPALLLLDEPTAGLDLLAREQVLATVAAMHNRPHRTTTVMITHHIEELPVETSRVLLLKEGRCVASGAPKEVITSDLLSATYGCPLTVRYQSGRFYTEVDPSAWSAILGR